MATHRGLVTLYRGVGVLSDPGAAHQVVADAVAVAEGRVVAVGEAATLRRELHVASVLDVGGWLLPGLEDAHCHPTIAAEESCHPTLDLQEQRDVERIARALEQVVPSNGWLKLVGWLASDTGQGPLDLALLDHLAPHDPLIVVHANGHWGYLNTAGLRRLGLIDERGRVRQTAVPRNGWVETRDGDLPTGRVFEQVLFDVVEPALARDPAQVALAGFAERRAAMETIERRYLARGVTAMTEALCGASGWELLASMTGRGTTGPRYSVLVSAGDLELARRLRTDGNDRLRVIGLKSFVDGALNGGTCMLSDPPPDVVPQQLLDRDEVVTQQRHARGLGLDFAVHANGDAAIDVLLAAGERSGLAGRIEHGSFIRDDQVERIGAQGWSVVPFGSYIHEHGHQLVELYGEHRVAGAIRHRTLSEAGIPVAGSSDYPCAGYDPWTAMLGCVTRRTSDGQLLGPDEALSPRAALGLYTRGSAGLRGGGPTAGTLQPGAPADLIAVAVDPRTRDGLEQMQTRDVMAAIVGGELVHDATTTAAPTR